LGGFLSIKPPNNFLRIRLVSARRLYTFIYIELAMLGGVPSGSGQSRHSVLSFLNPGVGRILSRGVGQVL
jgi:hypothetical protein